MNDVRAANFGVHPRLALTLLTALNFLNYIDRYILAGVKPLVQAEFRVSNAQMGLLTTAFFLCYMAASPLTGWLADRYSRRNLILLGAFLWSGATLLTALTNDFTVMMIRHTVVGIGEASFVAIAPAYISDLFPQARRGRMLSLFYLAIPMGAALGYILGGALGAAHGWRFPFYVCSAPAVLVGLLLLFLKEPQRGIYDTVAITPERVSLKLLGKNMAYLTATLGMAMLTFAMGGISDWMPTFLYRERGMSLERANLLFGLITVVNGLVATVIGGWWGDAWLKRDHRAYYRLSAWSMALCCPAAILAFFGPRAWMLVAITVAEFFLFLNTGPLNTAIVNSVSAKVRAGAVAVNIFLIHLLGDASSPWIIGKIADRSNLAYGFIPAFVAVALSSAILFYGSRFAPVPHTFEQETAHA
jgi:MFS transporter, Spinster family, sphingosine-1-phosphate transporter